MTGKTLTKTAALALAAAIALSMCSRSQAQAGGSSAGSSSSGSSVRASPVSDFSYTLTKDGRGIKITRYTGSGGAVVIPSVIEDYPVLEIGDNAFQGASGYAEPNNRDAITSVVVPDSVEVIGSSAFAYIDELTKATLPDGLKRLPDFIFSGCPKLTSANLPASLEAIGMWAFGTCRELADLVIPDNLTSVKFLYVSGEKSNNAAFVECEKLPIRTRQRIQGLGYTGF